MMLVSDLRFRAVDTHTFPYGKSWAPDFWFIHKRPRVQYQQIIAPDNQSHLPQQPLEPPLQRHVDTRWS